MEFGVLIEENEDLKKVKIYNIVKMYYDNPEMYKIKDVENYSVYMCKIKTLLSIDNRYLVAVVDKDNNDVFFKQRLDDLQWISFQARTLKDIHNIPSVIYTTKKGNIYNSILNLKERTPKKCTYTSDELGISIDILNDDYYTYSDKGKLYGAFETWQMVLTFI